MNWRRNKQLWEKVLIVSGLQNKEVALGRWIEGHENSWDILRVRAHFPKMLEGYKKKEVLS